LDEHDILMEYTDLQFGREDADCRYGDKMYIVRLREEPVFGGYFCGRVSENPESTTPCRPKTPAGL